MTVINYPANSPYSNTPQSSWSIGRIAFKSIPPDSTDSLYVLQTRHKYRPDTLSYELYGTPAYWWVFSVRNPALRADPIWDFLPGLLITVPENNYLRNAVGG